MISEGIRIMKRRECVVVLISGRRAEYYGFIEIMNIRIRIMKIMNMRTSGYLGPRQITL